MNTVYFQLDEHCSPVVVVYHDDVLELGKVRVRSEFFQLTYGIEGESGGHSGGLVVVVIGPGTW